MAAVGTVEEGHDAAHTATLSKLCRRLLDIHIACVVCSLTKSTSTVVMQEDLCYVGDLPCHAAHSIAAHWTMLPHLNNNVGVARPLVMNV